MRDTVKHHDGTRTESEKRSSGGSTERTYGADGKLKDTVSKRVNPRTGKVETTKYEYGKDGAHTRINPSGSRTRTDRDGTITKTSPRGNQTVIKSTRNGDRIVINKTTVINGNRRTRNYDYRGYQRHGRSYYVYVPVYNPYFYNPWFYTPWYTPYAYNWYGWNSEPWYGYYGWYYRPYRTYASPAYWLTDYLIADMLAARYHELAAEEQQQRQQTSQAAISEEIKEQVAAQVKVALENYKANEPVTLERALDPKHVFAVHDEVSAVEVETGEEVALGQGDLLRLVEMPGEQDEVATMVVVTSASGGVQAGAKVQIALSTLQEMEDAFAQRVESGLEKMKEEKEAGRLR